MENKENQVTPVESGSEHHHSSEHHHGSGHHKSKRRRKESRKAQQLRYFFKKNKKKLILNTAVILGSLLLLAAVLVMVTGMDKKQPDQENTPREDISVAVLSSSVRLEVPFYTTPQYLVGEAVRAFMSADQQQSISDTVGEFWSSKIRLDAGLPVELSYDVTGIPEGCKVERAVFEVSETESFENARAFEPKSGSQSVSVPHLKTGTQYQYRITLYISNGAKVMTQSSFHTADTPRFLSVDGVVNVRDIGGWKTQSGKTIRQGLLYRGSELDGRVETDYQITSAGMDTMLDVLGIKTEMDLRGSGYTGALGAQVNYLSYQALEYESILKENSTETVCRLFSDLSQPENYPVYMHCTYGMDRTGTVCFLLEALLGVGEEDLVREYELSAMYFGGINEERFDALLVELKRQPGGSLMEKAENYLLSAGVTRQQIDSIRTIFVAP